MAGLGIGIAWAGYALLYYGVTQVQGGNWGLLDLCIPSRWAAASGNPKDDGTKSAQTPATAATSAATAAAPVVGTVNKLPGGLDFIGGMTSTTTSKKAKKGTPNTPPLVLDILKALGL